MSDQPRWIREPKPPKISLRIKLSDIHDKVEFDSILSALTYPRDKAFIALMADGGFRIGGLLSCQIKSAEFNQYGAVIYLNPEGSNKTTPAKEKPLTWSTGYLNQ